MHPSEQGREPGLQPYLKKLMVRQSELARKRNSQKDQYGYGECFEV